MRLRDLPSGCLPERLLERFGELRMMALASPACFGISKASTVLKYSPRVGLDDALLRTAAWHHFVSPARDPAPESR